jgi:site-specific DNA-methyltransferase (adenine-specific)
MVSELCRVEHGDCLTVMRTMPDRSVDAVVTDPPYGLEFMGREWDAPWKSGQVVAVTDEATNGIFHTKGFTHGVRFSRGTDEMRAFQAWCTEWAIECLRLLKPGGHLLAFGGSRTYHRLACAVEDAGFEIRDQIMWVYGSGFPKSLNVSKAIDKMAGEPVRVGKAFKVAGEYGARNLRDPEPLGEARDSMRHEAISHDARRWKGWGTALKPAHEPIVLARKPLDGTVAESVLTHGTGALNIDGCRVGRADGDTSQAGHRTLTFGSDDEPTSGGDGSGGWSQNDSGRFPANFIHDGSDEVLELFPETASTGNGSRKGYRRGGGSGVAVGLAGTKYAADGYADGGSAARFFYCAKASRAEREAGLNDFDPKRESDRIADDLPGGDNPRNRTNTARRNHHPTVKPIALMRYLVRLVTPPNGVVLDPFTGSGTTGIAARLEGFEFVGIEQSVEYADIAHGRIAHYQILKSGVFE